MKYLLYTIVFKLIPFLALATNYYFSNAGSDGAACSLAAPCASLTKANSISANAGDSILLKRGDLFIGSLNISRSGSVGNPIIYSAYGSGVNPIITGFVSLSTWTSMGSNLYESYCPTCQATVNSVSFNGIDQPVGRWPDTTAINYGYRTLTSGTTTSITDATLPSDTNWTGATAVARVNNFNLNTGAISAQSGGVLTVSSLIVTPTSGYGYFIQNDIRTLTTLGEYYWKSSVDSLIMDFVGSSPGANQISVSSIDTLVSLGANYITIDGIDIKGANKYGIATTTNANNDTIRNGTISFVGINAIENSKIIKRCSFSTLKIQNSHNNAISVIFPGEMDTCYIKNDSLINIGIIPGMGLSNNASYSGIQMYGARDSILNNYFYNIGGNGSQIFGGVSNVWRYNFIQHFNTQLCDAGGLYGSIHDGSRNSFIDNIIIDGVGQHYGTNLPTNTFSSGIYLDNGAKNWDVERNTMSGCSYGGIYTHFSKNCIIQSNLSYSNTYAWYWQEESSPDTLSGNSIKYNQFIGQRPNLCVGWYNGGRNVYATIASLDSNIYSRPTINDTSFRNNGGGFTYYNISGWRTLTNQDVHSKTSPIQLRSDAGNLFLYNPTMTPAITTLNNSYISPDGTGYNNGPLTLQPFTSIVLFQFPKIVIR